jgi:hypothetical protein
VRTLAYFLTLPFAALMIGCDTAASDPPAKPPEDQASQVVKPANGVATPRKKKEPGIAPAKIPVRKDL